MSGTSAYAGLGIKPGLSACPESPLPAELHLQLPELLFYSTIVMFHVVSLKFSYS